PASFDSRSPLNYEKYRRGQTTSVKHEHYYLAQNGSTRPPTGASIKRWEQAGASLITALKDYMEMCLNLGTNSLREGAEPKDLVSRIDTTLTTVHTTMAHHLNESTSALARTRNKLASPPFRFPEEILSEIFMNVTYDGHDADASRLSTMGQDIWLIYRRLFAWRLLHLENYCDDWRDALVAFRINGAHVHWDGLTFSTKLVELRIEKVALGYDDTIVPLMRALASATGLRDLKIISVTIFRRLGASRNPALSSSVPFPALQSLLIEDLHLNTLEHLLPIITPGSHQLTLFLSPDSLEISVLPDEHEDDETEDSEITDFDGLCRLLEHTSVDTLMLTGHMDDVWLGISRLTKLLKSIPTTRTLKMHCWSFGKSLCKGLTQIPSEAVPMPALRNIHFSTIDIHNPKSFRDMIASYPLRQIVLGGNVRIARHEGRGWLEVHWGE
ncbi:hypothetical protein FRC11_000446, partial [Ceratobasidium sp. 423]